MIQWDAMKVWFMIPGLQWINHKDFGDLADFLSCATSRSNLEDVMENLFVNG